LFWRQAVRALADYRSIIDTPRSPRRRVLKQRAVRERGGEIRHIIRLTGPSRARMFAHFLRVGPIFVRLPRADLRLHRQEGQLNLYTTMTSGFCDRN